MRTTVIATFIISILTDWHFWAFALGTHSNSSNSPSLKAFGLEDSLGQGFVFIGLLLALTVTVPIVLP